MLASRRAAVARLAWLLALLAVVLLCCRAPSTVLAQSQSSSATPPPASSVPLGPPRTNCSFGVTFPNPYDGSIVGQLQYDPTQTYVVSGGSGMGYALTAISGKVTYSYNASDPNSSQYPYDTINRPDASTPGQLSTSACPSICTVNQYDNLIYVNGQGQAQLDQYGWQLLMTQQYGQSDVMHLYPTSNGLGWVVSIGTDDAEAPRATGGTLQLGACTTSPPYTPPTDGSVSFHAIPGVALSSPQVFSLLNGDCSSGGNSPVLVLSDNPQGSAALLTSQPLSANVATTTPLSGNGFPSYLSNFSAAAQINAGQTAAYLVGGFNNNTQQVDNEVWFSLSGVGWQQLPQPDTAIFSARSQAGLVALLGGTSVTINAQLPSPVILLGGSTGPSAADVENDVWISVDQAVTWSQVTDAAAFSARAGMAVTVTAGAQCAAGCILLLGGADNTGAALNDVWLSTDSARTFRQMTPAAAFQGRVGAQITVSNTVVAEPLYGSTAAPHGYLLVMAGGTTSSGAVPADASAWLSKNGGWSWYPLLPVPSASFPYSLAHAAPFFDTVGALTFLGVQSLTDSSDLGAARLFPSLLGSNGQSIDDQAVYDTLGAQVASQWNVTYQLPPNVCFSGLDCFPPPLAGADVTEQWLAGTLTTNGNQSQVTCSYSGSCQCAPYTTTLNSGPSYWVVSGQTSGVGLGGSFSVGCTTDASRAAGGYLFDSTSSLFAPYQLTCQAGGVYNSALPPTSYCTSAYIGEQGSTFKCTPKYSSSNAAAPQASQVCQASQGVQSLRSATCYYQCGCGTDLSGIGATPLALTLTSLPPVTGDAITNYVKNFPYVLHFALTLCGNSTGAAADYAASHFGATPSSDLQNESGNNATAVTVVGVFTDGDGSAPRVVPLGQGPLGPFDLTGSAQNVERVVDSADIFTANVNCDKVRSQVVQSCGLTVAITSVSLNGITNQASGFTSCVYTFTVSSPQACGVATYYSQPQQQVETGLTCPNIACPLPPAPANGGILTVGFDSAAQSLITSLSCGPINGVGILTGPATQACNDGLFSPPLPGTCVVFNTDPCRIVSASNATTISCAANEIVVGGGGDCTDYDLYGTGLARGGFTINQPTSDLQGWQAVCVQGAVPPLSIYATCCLADTGTFLETPAAYSAQSSLSLAPAGTSFQQCERVTAATRYLEGATQATLTCPRSKQLITSGVECPPFTTIVTQVVSESGVQFGCQPANTYVGDTVQQLLSTAVCCESFASDTCEYYSQGDARDALLSHTQVQLGCPVVPHADNAVYDPLLLPGGPTLSPWASSIPLGVNATVISLNDSSITALTPTCTATFGCCYILPRTSQVPANPAIDYCSYYNPDVTNGIGSIVSSNPAAPSSLGATYTLECPTPYTYVSGAQQVQCTPSGRWQGYAPDGTAVSTLGTCEAIETGQCVAVEVRTSPASSPCTHRCGCYYDLSSQASLLPSGPVVRTNNFNIYLNVDPCLNPLSGDAFSKSSCDGNSSALACLSYFQFFGTRPRSPIVAVQPSPDPASYLQLGTAFGSVGNVAMSASFSLNQPYDYQYDVNGDTKHCSSSSLAVQYVCAQATSFTYATTDECNFSATFSSPLLCTQPTIAPGAPSLTADGAMVSLQCPSTAGVSYVMTQAGATCPGNSGNKKSPTPTTVPVAPLVVSSRPSALDTWEAVCYDNSNLQPAGGVVPSVNRFYPPSVMRGVCCPTTASQLYSTCSYNPGSLSCGAQQIAVTGGGNCQTVDTVATGSASSGQIASNLLTASYNTGLFAVNTNGSDYGSVLGADLSQWTVQCSSAAGASSPLVTSVTRAVDQATVCCDNPVVRQPSPVGTAPTSYVGQQSLSSLQLAQTAVAVPKAVSDPTNVLARYHGTGVIQFSAVLTLDFMLATSISSSLPAGQRVVLAISLTLSFPSGNSHITLMGVAPAQLQPLQDSLCESAIEGNIQNLPEFSRTPTATTPFIAGQGGTVQFCVGGNSENCYNFGVNAQGKVGTDFSYTLDFTKPLLPYSAVVDDIQVATLPAQSIATADQVCTLTLYDNCDPSHIQLASSFQCQAGYALQVDYPLELGTSSITSQEHSYLCGQLPQGVGATQLNTIHPDQRVVCCAAYSLCTVQQPLPVYVNTTGLQLSIPDGQFNTAYCLAGYGFPSIVPSITISCDITNTGLVTLTLPECLPTGCTPLLNGISPELPGGNGRLSALTGVTGDIAFVECDPGYALALTAVPSITCTGSAQVGGSNWQPAPPTLGTKWCVLADSSLTVVSVSFPSQYAYTLSWSNFTASLPSGATTAPMWNLTHTLLFPSAVQLSASNAQESGLLVSESVQLPIDTRTYTFVVDSNAQIEGAIVQYELYAYVPRAVAAGSNTSAPNLYNSQTVSAVVDLPCGCDVAGNAQGGPQQVTLVQSLDSTNALTLSLVPQSLCNPNYQVVQRNETTQTTSNAPLALIQSYYAQNNQSCPYLTTTTQTQVGQVTWQTAGQVANYCLTAVPQAICTACVPIYSPGRLPPFGNGTAPDITACASLTILYYVPISGVVTTPAQYGAAAPVANVTVIAIVTDTGGSPVLYYDPALGVNVTVTATGVTDQFGQYSMVLNSTLITSQFISVTITASRVDQLYDNTPMVVSTQELDTTTTTTVVNTTRTVTQTVTVASTTTLNATTTEQVTVVETATLTPYRVLQIPVGSQVTLDDGSSTTVTVTNTTQLSVQLNTTCPPPVVNHSLTTAPVVQVASQSPYQMCGILRGPASNAWTVSLVAGVTTTSALLGNVTGRTGVPLVGAGWAVTRIVGYRLYYDATGKLVSNVTFYGLLGNTTATASLLYPYGSAANAYTVSGALGVGNDQPSQNSHVLDGTGIVLNFTRPATVEGTTTTASTLTLLYDYTAGPNGQYREAGGQAQQPAYSSLTYTPLINNTLTLNCSVPAVLPPAGAFSPSAVTQLTGTLVTRLSFDNNGSVVDLSNAHQAITAVGSPAPSLDNTTARFGNGSLHGTGSATPSYLAASGLNPFGTQSSLTSASISVWVRWPVTNTTAPLQPIVSVGQPTGAPQLSLAGLYNGSVLLLQFTGPVPSSRGGVATTFTGSAPLSSVAWTHVALVWDTTSVARGVQVSLYINATLVASKAISTASIPGVSGSELDVGGSHSAAHSAAVSFSGSMDELLVFSKLALSQAQVAQLYLYNLPSNVPPQFPLGVLVRAAVVPSYSACDLVNADTVTQTVLLSTNTTTTTTVAMAGQANRTSSLSSVTVQQLQWTTPWSPSLYSAFFNLASPSADHPTLTLADYRNCSAVNSSSSQPNGTAACSAYPPDLLSQLSLLNATSNSTLLSPVLLDANGRYLSPYVLSSNPQLANSVLLPGGVVNTTYAQGQASIVASPLSRPEALTQVYSNGDALTTSSVTSILPQLAIVNSTVELLVPGAASLNTAVLVIYLTGGINLTVPLSGVVAYAVPSSATPGQTDPSWPILVQLGPVQISSVLLATNGSLVTQTATLNLVTLTVGNTSAVVLNSSVTSELQQATTTTTTTSTSTTTTTVSRTEVAYNYTHVITSIGGVTANDSLTKTATLGQSLQYVNFQDNSTVAVSGQVTFAANVATPGVQYCGVEGVIVQAYLATDTQLVTPVGTSAPTGPDGMYVLGVTAAQQLVLVATFGGNVTVHTFSPNNVSVSVSHSPIAGLYFQDTTTQPLVLSIVGGLCESPVGYVTPVLVLNTCGGIHIPLPAFSNYPEQYSLPAFPVASILGYTADPQDGSGLQVPAQPTSAQVAYQAQVNAWLVQNAQLQLNLSVSGATVQLVYTSDTDITLVQPSFANLPCAEQTVGGQAVLPYDVQQSGQPYSLVFQLSQTYGAANISGVSTPSVCGNINGSRIQLFVHDELTDNVGSTCASSGCALSPVYDPVADTSTVRYTTLLGVPYIFPRNPQAANYSRDLRYGIAGTFQEEVNVLSVVITGSLAYAGVSDIVVPPQNTLPLYILRRPPGGASVASYSSTFVVTTTITHVGMTTNDNTLGGVAGFGLNVQISALDIFGIGEAIGFGESNYIDSLLGHVDKSTDTNDVETAANFTTTVTSYSQTFTTTNDQFTVDGAGDAFLLLAASINQSLSTTVSASIPAGGAALNPACLVSVFDTPTAAFNPARSLVWFDIDQINSVEIPAAQQLMTTLIAQNGGSTVFIDPNQQLVYYQAQDAVNNWQALLDYNEQLKADAVPWPELLNHVAFGNASNPLDLTATDQLDSTTPVLTFNGDAQAVEFTILNTAVFDQSNTTDKGSLTTLGGGFDAEVLTDFIDVTGSFQYDTITGFDFAVTVEMNSEQDTTLDIYLSDPDHLDQFQVAILRDPVYNTPVYRTLSGQSRCTPEQNTVSREYITMTLATNTFVQVPPSSRLSTTITINNASPTKETFAYLLNVDIQSNAGGLIIEADGLLLTHNVVQLTMAYGSHTVALVMYREDGSAFSYPGITLVLSSADCGVGLITLFRYADSGQTYDTATLSVDFIPQCAAVAFAGDLAYSSDFVVNAASKGLYTFVASNPDYYVAGQSWEALQAAGTLTGITAQYKPSAGNNAEWQAVPIYKGAAFAPLTTPLTNDYYAFTADLSQLPAGQYDFRLVAQCAQPAQGVTDTSLYQTISSVVTAAVDLSGPDVLTYEPGVQPSLAIPTYFPGDEISVSFTEPVVCIGTTGSLRYTAVTSATAANLSAALQNPPPNSIALLVAYCQDNKISLDFRTPSWASLVGKYVAVSVAGFTDAAGNGLNPLYGLTAVTWAFQVGQFNYTDATVTIRGMQLSVFASALMTGKVGTSSGTGGGHRRLLNQPESAASQVNATGFAAQDAASSLLFFDVKAAVIAQFEAQLEQQLQVEVVHLITAWFAANGRTLSAVDFYPSQVALDSVQAEPVAFDVVLLPAAAATVSPAEAAHAFVSAMEAAVLAGPGSLDNATYPLLSLYSMTSRVGLDGTPVVPLTIDVSVPTFSAPAPASPTPTTASPALATASVSSGGGSSSSSSGAAGASEQPSSGAATVLSWLWPVLCAVLSVVLLLLVVALAAMRSQPSAQKELPAV